MGSGLLGRNNSTLISPRETGYLEGDTETPPSKKEVEEWGRMIRILLNLRRGKAFLEGMK